MAFMRSAKCPIEREKPAPEPAFAGTELDEVLAVIGDDGVWLVGTHGHALL